ncbi:MAG: Holliday junction branch migration protein RuvA [Thiotrichales bacterium]|nr:Holliday junction branch migration protein RuvA [Thiotrichales bacterium]
MIGQIRGILTEKHPPLLIVEANGVGYEIEAPMTTIYDLPDTGTEILLYTHLVVREDAHLLFGFATQGERRLFRALIKVNGVGAKMALTILSGMETHDFALCIQNQDAERLVKLPGVGKKTAERLIVEMRDRLEDTLTDTSAGLPAETAGTTYDPITEAISALIGLGYKPSEASKHVHAIAVDEMGSEELIRAALKASVSR